MAQSGTKNESAQSLASHYRLPEELVQALRQKLDAQPLPEQSSKK